MSTEITQFYIASVQARIDNLNQLVTNAELVRLICQLIHQLQRERGISNIYLSSKGERFTNQINQQHDTVDRIIADLKPHLNDHYLKSKFNHPVNLLNTVARGLLSLETLHQSRTNTIKLQKNALKSTQFYNEVIARWIEVIFSAADLIDEPAVSRCLLSLFNLIQAKEYAGQERANGAIGFTETCFNSNLITRLEELSHIQQAHFDYFTHFADQKTLAQWQQHRDSQIVKDFNQIKQMMVALEDNTAFSSDISEVWFELTTKRIDALYSIESDLTQRFVHLANHQVEIEKNTIKQKKLEINQVTQDNITSSQLTNINNLYTEAANQSSTSHKIFYDLLNEQSRELLKTQHELSEAKVVLEEQKWVNRAKLVLMQKYQLSEEEAYRNLRKTAMNQNKRIVELAKMVIEEFKEAI